LRTKFVNPWFYLICSNTFKKIEESLAGWLEPICQKGSLLLPQIEETAVWWQVCCDVRQDTRGARGEPDVQE